MKKDKFKLFGIIHLADILMAIVMVALVFGAMQFSAPRQVSARAGDVMIRYTIQFGDVRSQGGHRMPIAEGFHKNIQADEPLFDGARGLYVGTIVDIFAKPYYVEAPNEAYGVFSRTRVEGLEFVYVVVEAPAQIGSNFTLIGQNQISVGREIGVRSRDFAGRGFVVSIEHLNGR